MLEDAADFGGVGGFGEGEHEKDAGLLGVEVVGGDHAEGCVVFAGRDAAGAGAVGADDDGSFGLGEGFLFDVRDEAGTAAGHDDAFDAGG